MAVQCNSCGAIHFHPKGGSAPPQCRGCGRDLNAPPPADEPTAQATPATPAKPRSRREHVTLKPNWPAALFGLVVAVGGCYAAVAAPPLKAVWQQAKVKYDDKFVVTKSTTTDHGVYGKWQTDTGHREYKASYAVNGKSYPYRMGIEDRTTAFTQVVWVNPATPADYRASKPTEFNPPVIIGVAVAVLGLGLAAVSLGMGTDVLLVREVMPVTPAEAV